MPRRILFFSPSWLGDAVMALPTLRGLRRAHPDAVIGVVARAGVADLFRAVRDADEVLVYRRAAGAGRLVSYIEFLRRLRAFTADLALVVPRSFGAAWTALLADAPRRIGYRASGRDLLLTEAVTRDEALLRTHRVRYYEHLLGPLGVAPTSDAPSLKVPEDARESAARLIAPLLDRDARRVVGIIPGAQYGSAKQWPEERFVQLCKRLRDELRVELVMLGGQADRDVCDRIRHEVAPDAVLDLSGRTTVLELAAVLERCRFAVSNDTGAMHVAAAVDTPVVAIFGSTDPVTTAPYGTIHTLLREPGIECAPCLLRTCPIDHRCMMRIGVDRVFAACARRVETPLVDAVEAGAGEVR